MRRKIKKEIKGIIQTMSMAHEHVLFLLKKKYIAEVNDLLSQCQDCAAHIGESIEKSEAWIQRRFLIWRPIASISIR